MIRLLYKIRKPFKYKYLNVAYILIGINVAVFILHAIANRITAPNDFITAFFGLSYTGVTQLYGVWQFITYQFVHSSSGIGHLFFNMFALFMFGKALEKKMGSWEFLTLYLVSGMLAGLLHFFVGMFIAFLPQDAASTTSLMSSATPLIGASGSIFALLLAYAIYFSDNIIYLFGMVPVKAKHAVLGLAGFEVLMLLTTNSSISNLTHLGGLGAAWLYFLIRKNINPAKVLFKKNRYKH